MEVHPNPNGARCDRDQALSLDDFAQIVADMKNIATWSQFDCAHVEERV